MRVLVLVAALGAAVACGGAPPASSTPSSAASSAVEPSRPPDAAPAPPADRDGDGIVDPDDLCPDQAMVMSAGCAPEAQRGCPDDCRPPGLVAP